jgi:S-(hydroxymethyl)glutathione dehydrogenase/alcohol dehydrogenase
MGATVTFPAGAWSNGTKNQAGGNFAGVQTMRDVPRFIRLMETGQFDAKALVGQTFPLERTRDALQAAADRTTISSIVTV